MLPYTQNIITLLLKMSFMYQELPWIYFQITNSACIIIVLAILMQMKSKFRIFLRGDFFTRAWVRMVYPIYSKNFIKSSSHFNFESSPQKNHPSAVALFPSSFHVNKQNKWLLWHHRLGHPSDKVLDVAFSSVDNVCISKSNKSFSHCKHCLSGKMHQFSFPIFVFQASKPLELVHSDV